jgi:hypothetical protein
VSEHVISHTAKLNDDQLFDLVWREFGAGVKGEFIEVLKQIRVGPVLDVLEP